MSILETIFANRREEVARQKIELPPAEMEALAIAAPLPPDFYAALESPARAGRPALIAEIKRRSPSRGALAVIPDPLVQAELYARNGAAAISILTESSHFGGSLEDLHRVAVLPGCPPLLRKDFICDPYQVFEARAAGASAVLLIAAVLPPLVLGGLHDLALALGLAPLVEIHNAQELEQALVCRPRLVGINNRDLADFTVRLETTLELCPLVPPGVMVVAESGIHTRRDVERLAEAGVAAILVGEALVSAIDIPATVRSLALLEPEASPA